MRRPRSSPSLSFPLVLSVGLLLLLPACGGGCGGGGHRNRNLAPVANAGDDRVIALPEGETTVEVQLDASASYDPDGTVTSYLWSGPVNPKNEEKPVVTLKQGTFDFELKVKDDKGEISKPDYVTITVIGSPYLMPIPEVTDREAIVIKGISLPGSTVTILNNSSSPNVIANDNGYFELEVPLVDGTNNIQATASYGGVASSPTVVTTRRTTSEDIVISGINPQSGQSGSIITITGSGFTAGPDKMGVQFVGSRFQSKGIVLKATDTEMKVVVPFEFATSIDDLPEEDLSVYVYDADSMSNSVTFTVIPAQDPTPDTKGNETIKHLELIRDQIWLALEKLEQFTKPNIPSEQWEIIERNIGKLLDLVDTLITRVNAIPSADILSALDAIFASDIFTDIDQQLELVNQLISHTSPCDINEAIRTLERILTPLRLIHNVLRTAEGILYAALVGEGIACFFGCVPCCAAIPFIWQSIQIVSAADSIVSPLLSAVNYVEGLLAAAVPTVPTQWKIALTGPIPGISNHLVYTDTTNTLKVYANFTNSGLQEYLENRIDLDQLISIDLPDPFGLFYIVEQLTGYDIKSVFEDSVGKFFEDIIFDIIGTTGIFNISLTDILVASRVENPTPGSPLSVYNEGALADSHLITAGSVTGTAELYVTASCGDFNYPYATKCTGAIIGRQCTQFDTDYPEYFPVEVIDSPAIDSGGFSTIEDEYCYGVPTCYDDGEYVCSKTDYRNYLSELCADLPPTFSACIDYKLCDEPELHPEGCSLAQYQGYLNQVCAEDPYGCSQVITHTAEECMSHLYWEITGKGFSTQTTPLCTKHVVHTCYYNGEYLCSPSEYRDYLSDICADHPNNNICRTYQACYDPESQAELCTLAQYNDYLETMCSVAGNCDDIISQTLDDEECTERYSFFEAYWNGKKISVSSLQSLYDSFRLYTVPGASTRKPGWLQVKVFDLAGNERESNSVFLPASPSLEAAFDTVNPALYPGDTLYLAGNYFTTYPSDHTITLRTDSLQMEYTPDAIYQTEDYPNYFTSDDLLQFTLSDEFMQHPGQEFDISVKVGEGYSCETNNCYADSIKVLPHESAGFNGFDDQDLTIEGSTSAFIRSAAVGDVNGDGVDDLIVGVPEYRSFGYAVGALYIFFGPVNPEEMVNGKPFMELGNSGWDVQIKGSVLDVDDGGNSRRIGNSIAVGDINGDGIDDLLIGTTDEDETFEHRPNIAVNPVTVPRHINGKAYILFGRSEWQASYDLTTELGYDMKFYEESGREFGYNVGIANYDSDSGRKAIIITAPTNPYDQNNTPSGAYIINGLAAWPTGLPKKDFKLPDDLPILNPYDYYSIIEDALTIEDHGNVYQADYDFKNGTISTYRGSGLNP